MNAGQNIDPALREASVLLDRWRVELDAEMRTYADALARSRALSKMIEGMEALYPALKAKSEMPPAIQSMARTMVERGKESVERMLENVGDMTPAEAAEAASDPTAAGLVREILRSQPTRWFTSGDMVKEFRARGNEASPTAIRLALRRTAGKETVKRGVDKGQTFRLRSEETDADLLGGLEP